MDLFAIRSLFQAELAKSGEPMDGYVRYVADGWALVTGTKLTAATVDKAIQTEIAHFRALNRDFEWKVYSWDTPANLQADLLRHGFQQGDEEAIMVFDLSQGFDHWGAEITHRTVKVATEDHLEDYRTVERQLGSPHSYLEEVVDSMRRDSNDSIAFIAYHGEHPVSIARLNRHAGSPFGGCYGGSTLPQYQRQGFYRSLLLARAIEACRLGVQYLQVDSLPTSRPILERLGFKQIGSTWPFTWSPHPSQVIQ